MVRGTLVVDTKLLKDHFLRQQRGGNIAGYRGARFQRGYGIGGIFKSLRDMLSLYSNKELKLLAKEHYKQPHKLVKMYFNLSSVKKQKLEEYPRRPKWIRKDESDCDDESSHDDESESETSQTSDDIY